MARTRRRSPAAHPPDPAGAQQGGFAARFVSWLDGIGAWLLAPLVGAAACLAFAPLQFFPAIVPLLAFWYWAATRTRPLRAFLLSLAAAAPLFLIGIAWVVPGLQRGAGLSFGVASFGYLVAALGMALHIALAAAALAWAARSRWSSPFGLLAAAPALWMLNEFLRHYTLEGWPWLTLAEAIVHTPARPLIAVLGSGGAGGWLVLIVAAGVEAVAASSTARRALGVAAACIGVLAVSLPAMPGTQPDGEVAVAALTSHRLVTQRRITRSELDAYLAPMVAATMPAIERGDARLVVWPESAVPVDARSLQRFLGSVQQRFAARDAMLGLGLHVFEGEAGAPLHQYNGAIYLGQDVAVYRKRKLVPIGEYQPYGMLNALFSPTGGTAAAAMQSGPAQPLPVRTPAGPVLTAICFEIAFGELLRHHIESTRLLVTLTNDAWFAGSFMADQHLAIAQVRAVELGRPLVRASNGGASALISADGRVVERLASVEPALLEGRLQRRAGQTPYVRAGGQVPVLLGAFVLALAGFASRPAFGAWRR